MISTEHNISFYVDEILFYNYINNSYITTIIYIYYITYITITN